MLKNTTFAHVARQILFSGDPSQQMCVKCPLYPLPSSSYSIYSVTYTWVPRVRLSSTSSHHRFQVTFNLRPWRARGCERRPWRAAAAARPLRFAGMEGTTCPLRPPAAMEGTGVRAPARRRLTAASPCEPRPPAAAAPAARAPTVMGASSPSRRCGGARSARRRGSSPPNQRREAPRAEAGGGGPGERGPSDGHGLRAAAMDPSCSKRG
jgi:hypothetical protein